MNSFGPFSNSCEAFANRLIFWGIVLKCLGIVLNCLGVVLRLLRTTLVILWVGLGTSQRHQIKRPRQPLTDGFSHKAIFLQRRLLHWFFWHAGTFAQRSLYIKTLFTKTLLHHIFFLARRNSIQNSFCTYFFLHTSFAHRSFYTPGSLDRKCYSERGVYTQNLSYTEFFPWYRYSFGFLLGMFFFLMCCFSHWEPATKKYFRGCRWCRPLRPRSPSRRGCRWLWCLTRSCPMAVPLQMAGPKAEKSLQCLYAEKRCRRPASWHSTIAILL